MIRHDIVGVRKEKVILIVTGPFPFGLITRYTQEMSAFGLLRQPQEHPATQAETYYPMITGDTRPSRVELLVTAGMPRETSR